jgi:hypothetical protein
MDKKILLERIPLKIKAILPPVSSAHPNPSASETTGLQTH